MFLSENSDCPSQSLRGSFFTSFFLFAFGASLNVTFTPPIGESIVFPNGLTDQLVGTRRLSSSTQLRTTLLSTPPQGSKPNRRTRGICLRFQVLLEVPPHGF